MSTKHCPVCGSSDLISEVVMSAIQTNSGDWEIVAVNQDELNAAILDQHNPITCNNMFCGKPYHNGKIIELNGISLIEWWADYVGQSIIIDEGNPVEEGTIVLENFVLTQEQAADYDAFSKEITYEPWSGLMGDCETLE